MGTLDGAEPAAYALAYDEGKLRIADQAATLKETRDRIGTLVSAAGVTAALAAGLTARTGTKVGHLGVAGIALAAVGFGVITIAAVLIWWPMTATFSRDSGVLVGSYVEGDPAADLAEMHRELALHLGRHAAANRERLDGRLRCFAAGLAGFLVEVVGLLLLVLDLAR